MDSVETNTCLKVRDCGQPLRLGLLLRKASGSAPGCPPPGWELPHWCHMWLGRAVCRVLAEQESKAGHRAGERHTQVTNPRGTALLCCAQQKVSWALSCLNWSTATPVLREGPGVLGQRAGSRRGTRKASPWGTGLQQQGLIQVTRGERQRAPS